MVGSASERSNGNGTASCAGNRLCRRVICCYPANLCPLWRYVVNEVRRLADDPLSHYERPNARQAPERRHCLLKHAVGTPGMTNFEQKRMMASRSVPMSWDFNIGEY